MAPDAAPSTSRTVWAALAVALMALVAYVPALSTGFTADDFFILARVKALDGLAHPGAYFGFGFFEYYRPVAFLSHAVDWQVWGLNAFGFHLTNVLWHAGCTVLVFLLGRRLLTVVPAGLAALLFTLHPASHEAVYWMAARFDLMATFFTLAALWCLMHDGPTWRAAGVACFGLGLLSKESAISLLVIVPAWDVFVAKRGAEAVIRRLALLVAVTVIYMVVRTFGADLEMAGGARRVPKLIGMAAVILVLVQVAWRRDRGTLPDLRLTWLFATGAALVIAACLWWPVTAASAAAATGFAAYAAFYLISPIVLPPPPVDWFAPSAMRDVLPGFIAICVGLAVLVNASRAFAREAALIFLCLFVAAAIMPVSSMPGGLRYLYLASAGVSLLAGWLIQRVPRGGRLAVAAVVTAVLVVSATQLVQAGRAWRAGSDMTRDGVVLMSSSLAPCGSKDVLLLTAPVGVGGVYANFYFEAFDVLTSCSPRSFAALLRIVGTDAHVDVTTPGDGVIELRVPGYRGSIMASADLSAFTIAVPPGLTRTVDTAIGRLEILADGPTQIFRLTPNDRARGAERFYYSDGAVRRVPPRAALNPR